MDRGTGERPAGDEPFCPIRDYGVVGDCQGAALISRWGTVDWCCLERFDADPALCRMLDPQRGGFLATRPRGSFETDRMYLGRTNVLRTTFRAETGRLEITDFMPVGRVPGAPTHDYVTLNAPFWFVRILEARDGPVPVEVGYRPTLDFGRSVPELALEGRRVTAHPAGAPAVAAPPGGCAVLHGDVDFEIRSDRAVARFELEPGQRRHLILAPTAVPEDVDLGARSRELLRITRAFWEEWADYVTYDGPHADAVLRSVLTLKLLTYAPSGAIVAAPTTSLPEEIGGERNWDYRYCWIRDAAFTLDALASTGYRGAARDFAEFLLDACPGSPEDLRIMYGLRGEAELPERTLEHLRGYRDSRPVRVGNAAYDQLQLDIYGELLDWAHLYEVMGGRLSVPDRDFLQRLVDVVADRWREKDCGIWEVRGEPRRYVYGKIMSWTAVDRAIRIFGSRPEWEALREEIRAWVLEHGVDPDGGFLRQSDDSSEVDASLLLAPAVGFPVDREIMQRTVEEIRQRLGEGVFLRRYRSPDGLPGEEGAFLICSFWLVNALVALDRPGEARELFDQLCARANDLSLFSEAIDPESDIFLGNYPQAFTHLALVEAAISLHRYRAQGSDAIWKAHLRSDPAARPLSLASGLDAFYNWLRTVLRTRRILPSRKSVLPAEWGECPETLEEGS